jgi:hypothetical protein
MLGTATVWTTPRRKLCISPKSLFQKEEGAIKTAHNAMAAVVGV